MVLDRGPGKGEPMASIEQAARLGRGRLRVLDRLRLVEDDVVELDAGEPGRVAAQRAVGSQHQVGAGELVEPLRARHPGEIEDAQVGSEAARLLLPVEYERARNDDERRSPFVARLRRAPPVQQREHHHRLAQAHVVGEAPADAELLEECEPAEALALVAAQRPIERRRRVERTDAVEVAQPLSRPREGVIPAHLRLRLEESVEERRLGRLESHVIAGLRPEPRDRRVPAQPLLGQESQRSVVEAHHLLATLERGEERRQVGPEIPVGHPAVQLEPIDSRAHRERRRAGAADRATLRLHVPTIREQRAHDRRQRARSGEPRNLLRVLPVRALPAAAQPLEVGDEPLLRRQVAADGARGRGGADHRASRGDADERSLVLEAHVCDQAIGSGGIGRETQSRAWRTLDHLDAKLRGSVDERRWLCDEGVEELEPRGLGHAERGRLAQRREPVEGAAMVEPRRGGARDHQPIGEDEERVADLHALRGAAAQPPVDQVTRRRVVTTNADLELPWRAAVPPERQELRLPLGAHHAACGCAQERQQLGGELSAQAKPGESEAELVAPRPRMVRPRAAQPLEDAAILAGGQGAHLTLIEREGLRLTPLAVLLAAARHQLDDEGARIARCGRIDDVEESIGIERRPRVARRRIRLGGEPAEQLLPGSRPRRWRGRALERLPRRSRVTILIAFDIVIDVDGVDHH